MTHSDPTEAWNPISNLDHWELVSAYCDRWCGRCRHRARCLVAGDGIREALIHEEPRPSLEDDPLMRPTNAWRQACLDWLADRPAEGSEGPARELDQVLGWHAILVPNKLYRALLTQHHGRRSGPTEGPHPNDAQGSAKVAALGLYACISILTRWCEAHRLDHRAMEILMETSHLLEQLQGAFPDHMSFRRPGFED